jgi:hypothetical protein
MIKEHSEAGGKGGSSSSSSASGAASPAVDSGESDEEVRLPRVHTQDTGHRNRIADAAASLERLCCSPRECQRSGPDA